MNIILQKDSADGVTQQIMDKTVRIAQLKIMNMVQGINVNGVVQQTWDKTVRIAQQEITNDNKLFYHNYRKIKNG